MNDVFQKSNRHIYKFNETKMIPSYAVFIVVDSLKMTELDPTYIQLYIG